METKIKWVSGTKPIQPKTNRSFSILGVIAILVVTTYVIISTLLWLTVLESNSFSDIFNTMYNYILYYY